MVIVIPDAIIDEDAMVITFHDAAFANVAMFGSGGLE